MTSSPLARFFSRLRVIRAAGRSGYSFSWSDRIGYLWHAEDPCPPGRMPRVEEIGRADGFVRLRIGGDEYEWPADQSYDGLAYMHAEVFRPARLNFHAYEWGPVTIPPGSLVVDAGACEGFFTRYALRRGARVLAIEPTPLLACALARTFAEEIRQGRVRLEACALGARSAMGKLQVKEGQLYENVLLPEGRRGLTVPVRALDDLLAGEKAGFIKMDVEGGEMDALEGARQTLRQNGWRLAVAVYHGQDNARKVMAIIRQCNPSSQVVHRGLYAWAGVPPRPVMVFARAP